MFNSIPSDRYAHEKRFVADCFPSASIAESPCYLHTLRRSVSPEALCQLELDVSAGSIGEKHTLLQGWLLYLALCALQMGVLLCVG